MRPRPFSFYICALLWLAAVLTVRAQDLVPFGSNFLPTFTFSETYKDTVVAGDFGYEQVPTSSLTLNAKVSMKGVVVADLFPADGTFSITAGNLQLNLLIEEGAKSVVNGRETFVWELPATNPQTGENFVAGTVTLSYNTSDLTVRITAQNASAEYSIYAVAETSSEETLDDFPLLASFVIGAYGFTESTLYVDGTASLFDKTVGVGDEAQTFYNLSNVSLTGLIDAGKPALSIQYPAYRATITERPITARGTCTDSHGIFSVELSLNGGPFILADLVGNQWSVPFLDLAVGRNEITVRCTDQDGHVTTLVRANNFSLQSPLTVTAAGDAPGRITSAYFPALSYAPPAAAPVNVTKHTDGARRVITAVPGTGAVFDGWTSNKTLTEAQLASPTINFRHQPNMTLTAHFLINPFTPVKGTYNGLATGGSADGSGFFSIRLGNDGSFTGSLRVGSLRLPLKGRFSNTGRYTRTIKFKGVSYAVDLTLNVSGTGAEQISGSVNGGTLSVTIASDRAVFHAVKNPAPQAGTYNVIIPPEAAQTGLYPLGNGYGRVAVSTGGFARLSGRLASGPVFNAGAQLSATGGWPLFALLYGGKGSISGSVAFDLEDPAHDLSGALNWFKPPNVRNVVAYPEGFSGQSSILGARFQAPLAGERLMLNATAGAGTLTLSAENDAGLPAIQTSLAVSLSTSHVLTFETPLVDAPIQSLIAKVNSATGVFSGTFTESDATRTFRGVMIGPKLNRAAGFFSRGTRTGAIAIAPTP